MPQASKFDLKDFREADYTAIVSDLHLCEEEPVNIRFPLWKKYKTKQFFFDDLFVRFLHTIDQMAEGKTVELILNGDTFDFDSFSGLPQKPPYRVTWLEKRRGLHPQEEKSKYKMQKILLDHNQWVEGLRWFAQRGHRIIFVIGNHDLELHFPSVQQAILDALNLSPEYESNIRFNEWFYISNHDTLIEHGNQYDPYCMAQDPVNPYIVRFNRLEVRVPFGNLATRYMINGMGFFNPHVDSNFIMSLKEYIVFFFRYMLRAQPLLVWTWFWSSIVVMSQSFLDRLRPPVRDPLRIEDRMEFIAEKANATTRMVRELKELFVAPAASYPILIARELWLDRAFIVLLSFVAIFEIFLFINNVYDISFFWTFIPLFLLLPFFLFYTRSIDSDVASFKEPRENILSLAGAIAHVRRVVYGHTHIVRHEIIGPVEHLNSGTWSPAFKDVECEIPVEQKTFVWIFPDSKGGRDAKLYQFKDGEPKDVFAEGTKKKIKL